MGLFIITIKNRPRWEQLLIYSVAVFLSSAVTLKADAKNSAIVAHSAYALPLIQYYLQTNPIKIKAIKQTQDEAITKADQLQKISREKIETLVERQQPKQASLPTIYPIRSKMLTPGKVFSRRAHATLPQPIFIVGDGSESKRWLNRHQTRLIQLNAKGFVVNVVSKNAMQRLQQQFPKLSLMPMPGGALAIWLKLKHYPVLVSDKLIEQ